MPLLPQASHQGGGDNRDHRKQTVQPIRTLSELLYKLPYSTYIAVTMFFSLLQCMSLVGNQRGIEEGSLETKSKQQNVYKPLRKLFTKMQVFYI